MKKIQLLIFLIVVCCLASCHRRPVYPPVLHEADSLINVNADSALSMLKHLEADTASWTKAARMYHQLLTVKASDKAYHLQTSDSLMLQVLHYYEDGGDKRLLPEAYYYMGSTYRDLNDAPRALDYYQKAIDAMPGDENLRVKSKVYAQMGTLFIYQDLYSEALKMYQLSYQCDLQLNDTVGFLYNLRDIATSYRGLGNLDSTLFYFEKARKLADEYGSAKYESLITSQIASLQMAMGDYEQAKKEIMPSVLLLDSASISSVYSIAAKVYHHLGQIDSASYYYQKLLTYGTIYAKAEAYYQLAKIAEDSLQMPLAVSLLERYRQLEDSVKAITATESIAQMQSLYNYQISERENNQLRVRNANGRALLAVMLSLCILFLSATFFLWLRYQRRQRHMQRIIAQQKEEYYRRSEEHRLKAVKKIRDLEDEIAKKTDELDALSKLRLEQEIAQIESEQQQLAIEQAIHEEASAALTESAFVSDMKEKARRERLMTEADWGRTVDLLNIYYPGFLSKLAEMGISKGTKYQVCLLLKLNLSPLEIAHLVGRTPSAITKIRERLHLSIFGEQGTTEKFDSFIRSL